MHRSLSVALEPGSEQGAPPWGCDLYTFVTSAAGHMMRTLQKSRKNRPSKRQVNHRRFLHNMIQRKFADIEAAKEKKSSSSPQQNDEAAVAHLTDTDGVSESIVSAEVAQNPRRPQEEGEEEEEARPDTCRTTRKNQDQGTERQRSESNRSSEVGEIPQGSTLHPLLFDDSTQLDSALDPLGQTSPDSPPPFSPDLLSPLSLDSCDFSIQMFADVPPQAQRSGGSDAAESPWADILDLFGFGTKDPPACLDVGSGICDEDSAFADLAAGCHGDGDGCHRDQEEAMTRVPESTSCYFNQQRPQEPGGGHWEQKLPFEGVAQSFCAPALSSELRPPRVRTPPHEHDWLIPDILMERMTSPW